MRIELQHVSEPAQCISATAFLSSGCVTTCTHHLKRTAQNAAQDVAKPQPVFDRLFREFHELRQGVLVQCESKVRL
jgi:hypothetical protein